MIIVMCLVVAVVCLAIMSRCEEGSLLGNVCGIVGLLACVLGVAAW